MGGGCSRDRRTGEEGRGLFQRISSDGCVPGNIVPRGQGGAVFLRMPRDIGGWVGGGGGGEVEDYKHKVLTYVEYRAVSGIFKNIDPPHPFPASECVLHPHQRRGIHTRRAVRGLGGQYFRRRQT